MSTDTLVKKQAYFNKLVGHLEKFFKIFVVNVDNVGSSQMQQIRHSLRKDAEILMGKNTMIRKSLRGHLQKNPALETLLPKVKGNIGFVFTNGDLGYVKKKILENRVGAPARAGSFCPIDVFIPAGPTGLDPTQTTFLQALNISTKINKGQIEISSDVHLLKKGDKVGSSEAALLQKLNIKPFSYGLNIVAVYDAGCLYDPEVLDLSDEDVLGKFQVGVRNVAAATLALHYPSIITVPHLVINGYKNLLAIAVATEYSFPRAEKVKKYLADPSAFAAPVAAPPTGAQKGGKEEAKKEEPKKEEVQEQEDEDMGLDLFG
jgi:large subunit ribosomal protein LP0